MKRCLVILLTVGSAAATALGQTPGDRERTAAFVASLQNPDGGFGGKVGQASSLGSTSSAIRTLGYLGGSVRDIPGAVAYVKSCYDATSGGFSPTPGAPVEFLTTAVGLMAVAALKLDPDPYAEGVIGFLSKNAKDFDQARIAVASLEWIHASSPDFPRWIELANAERNPDGTFGIGLAKSRATGSRVVALLRMGVSLEADQKAAIIAALREGQKPDGGWSKGDGPSDLETSYRVMRTFFMLKAKPDLDRLRGYLGSFRQADGGYASVTGGSSELGGTYFCSVMGYWARTLDGEPGGFVPLFDGKSLEGWDGDSSLWSAKDGMLVGTSPGIKQNNFLATEASYGDFTLKFRVRLVGDVGNSGVQFRSVRVAGGEMSGYQGDIGPGYWACLYDESRRNVVLAKASPRALEGLKKGDWNDYEIQAKGDDVIITLNGVESIRYKETDPAVARQGKIAVQVHAGGAMRVEFKDILVQPAH